MKRIQQQIWGACSAGWLVTAAGLSWLEAWPLTAWAVLLSIGCLVITIYVGDD